MDSVKNGFTTKIAEFIVAANRDNLPVESYDHAKVAFLDWISVALPARDEPLVQKLIDHAEQLGGHQQATILGKKIQANVAQTALINGAMSHVLDYDDTLIVFLGHPTVTLFPGLLAMSEWKGLSGEQLLTAYIVGIQVGAWLGRCAGVGHYSLGWHGTSTIGRQASAAACANLLGLSVEQTTHCLGIAGTQAAGLKQVFGSMCKPFHAGAASQVGVEAALLAADGFTSATDIYEGELGFFTVLRGEPEKVEQEFLSNDKDIEQIVQKFHASCHCTHGPIDSILDLQKEYELTPEEVSDIKVYCSQISMDNASKATLGCGLDGKFSIAYCVATALLKNDTSLHAFTDEKVQDPEVLAMMAKIEVIVDDEHREQGLKTTSVVTTTNGQSFTHSLDPGSQVPPLEVKQEKIRQKFDSLLVPILGEERSSALRTFIEQLDKAEVIQPILSLAQN